MLRFIGLPARNISISSTGLIFLTRSIWFYASFFHWPVTLSVDLKGCKTIYLSNTCVSAFVEISQSLHCKIFKYTFLEQYPMKSWNFFFLCKIQEPAWLQLSHRKLGPPGMRLFRLLYPKTEKPSFKCDILLWKTLIRVSIAF